MINTLSHVNDNNIAHSLYGGESRHLPFLPAARYLINKYVAEYWKHDSTDLDYVYMESVLCGNLEMPSDCAISRELKVKWIARVLDVSPVLLHNDPDLPF